MSETVRWEMTFGERLRKARRSNGLTQQEMADALGVKLSRYGSWEADATTPRLRDALRVIDVVSERTGAPPDWLMEGLRTGRTEAGTGTSPLDVVTAGEPFDDLFTVLDQRRYHYAGNVGDPSRR